ncbi:hypothetical protein D3C86_2148600 [compost metagenome]
MVDPKELERRDVIEGIGDFLVRALLEGELSRFRRCRWLGEDDGLDRIIDAVGKLGKRPANVVFVQQ